MAVFLAPLLWLQSWMNTQLQQLVQSFSELSRQLMQSVLARFDLPIGDTIHRLFDGVLMGTGFLILPWAIIVSYVIFRVLAAVWRKYTD